MPRAVRNKSSTGIYHTMILGINKQPIFREAEDYIQFKQILTDCKKISGFSLFGYCLMGNHAQLLLKEGTEDLGQIFKRIGSRYVYWYNWKYRRSGHLFQDRYQSEPVESDAYFLSTLRYLHQKARAAGLCESLKDYEWSSYNDYFKENALIDREPAFSLIGEDEFESFMDETTGPGQTFLGSRDKMLRLTDEELREKIMELFGIRAGSISNMPGAEKQALLSVILAIEGVSARQLSRVAGVSLYSLGKLKSAQGRDGVEGKE